MRRLTTLVAITAAGVVLAACGGATAATSGTPSSSSARLVTRSVQAGGVKVAVTPTALDSKGAAFKVAFDTHSVDLGMDMTRVATLTVAGVDWPGPTWSGPGPGGHHREGTLRFPAASTPSGTAVLTITGLPAPVSLGWNLGGGS